MESEHMVAIRELIDRMKHDDLHKARAEAQQVTDLDALEEIKAILESTKDRTDKLYCYWILGDLGRSATAPQVANYLMERLPCEKTVAMREWVLRGAILIEGPWNPENAIAALADKNRGVRHLATQALGACTDPRAEETLIDIVDNDAAKDPSAAGYAAKGLARNGTHRCGDSLVSLVRRLPCNGYHEATISAALFGLARLGRADALPLAIEGLKGCRYNQANWARMLYIAEFGSEEQIDLVIGRLKSVVKRKNRQDLIYRMTHLETRFDDELSAGVSFLAQYSDERINKFFAFLRDNAASLFDREKSYLAANHADLEIRDVK
jgi:HEAT repeat protein